MGSGCWPIVWVGVNFSDIPFLITHFRNYDIGSALKARDFHSISPDISNTRLNVFAFSGILL